MLALLASAAASATLSTIAWVPAAPAQTAARQPTQPNRGPGGSASPFHGLRAIDGGSGYNAWEILTPVDPAPRTAPLVVVMHGYYEFSGYRSNDAIARHTALTGNVVIYPRWQTGIATPCPGPYLIGPCITSAATAIHDAIAFLHAHPLQVQPRLHQASYFGFSFGAIITADMTSRYKALGLPMPRAIWLDDPHDGGLTANNEPALYPSLRGIPATTKIVCHDGADGVISLTDSRGQSLADGGCNAVFPKLRHLPAANKSLVLTTTDTHGEPPLSSAHGLCAGSAATKTTPAAGVDAYDWGFCWRSFDALRACAVSQADCQYALGNTPQNRYIGTWSDGVPIIGLKVQSQSPIRALPASKRQPAPRPDTAGLPPHATIMPGAVASSTGRIVLTGTAAGDNGVVFIEVAVIRRTPAGCTQMSATGAFRALSACNHPTDVLFAAGSTRWSLALPVDLRRGAYRVLARPIDSFGQAPRTWTHARVIVR
jgi:hypothetical protein